MEETEVIPESFLKLLLLLKLAGQIQGKTKLHKMVFLSKEEEPRIDFGFEFTKYNYGPYSFDLTKALDAMETLGLIEVETSILPSTDFNGFQTKQFTYKITEKGLETTSNSKIEEKREVVEKIKQLVQKWNTVPRQKMIEHVYMQE